jgi:hypothetical protein
MIYEDKIDWADPNKVGDVLTFTQSKFKSAVLDYQIAVEGDLEDIIKRHFRDPKAYKVKYLPFQRRIDLVRALIGKTPDEGIWEIVKSLGELRNQYSHSRFTGTEEGIKTIKKMTIEIFNQLKVVRPDIVPSEIPDLDLEIISLAHLTVRRFFREINEALDNLGLPRSL